MHCPPGMACISTTVRLRFLFRCSFLYIMYTCVLYLSFVSPPCILFGMFYKLERLSVMVVVKGVCWHNWRCLLFNSTRVDGGSCVWMDEGPSHCQTGPGSWTTDTVLNTVMGQSVRMCFLLLKRVMLPYWTLASSRQVMDGGESPSASRVGNKLASFMLTCANPMTSCTWKVAAWYAAALVGKQVGMARHIDRCDVHPCLTDICDGAPAPAPAQPI